MEPVKVHTKTVPEPVGPYSQALRAGGLIYCPGQISLDPLTGQLAGSTISEQTERYLLNLAEVLGAAGSFLDKVLKSTVFLKELGDFPKMNETYAKFFAKKFPPRTTVEVRRLLRDALIEIEAVAVV